MYTVGGYCGDRAWVEGTVVMESGWRVQWLNIRRVGGGYSGDVGWVEGTEWVVL